MMRRVWLGLAAAGAVGLYLHSRRARAAQGWEFRGRTAIIVDPAAVSQSWQSFLANTGDTATSLSDEQFRGQLEHYFATLFGQPLPDTMVRRLSSDNRRELSINTFIRSERSLPGKFLG